MLSWWTLFFLVFFRTALGSHCAILVELAGTNDFEIRGEQLEEEFNLFPRLLPSYVQTHIPEINKEALGAIFRFLKENVIQHGVPLSGQIGVRRETHQITIYVINRPKTGLPPKLWNVVFSPTSTAPVLTEAEVDCENGRTHTAIFSIVQNLRFLYEDATVKPTIEWSQTRDLNRGRQWVVVKLVLPIGD